MGIENVLGGVKGIAAKVIGTAVGKIAVGVGLASMIAGIGTVVYKNVYDSKNNLGEQFERGETKTILYDSIPTPTKDGFGNKELIYVKLKGEKSPDGTIYFSILPEDYNRTDWRGTDREKLVYDEQNFQITPFSRLVVIAPENLEIKTEQRVYVIEKNGDKGFDLETRPYEEHQDAQEIIRQNEKVLEYLIAQSPLPLTRKAYEKLIWLSEWDNQRYQNLLLEQDSLTNLTLYKIPNHLQDNLAAPRTGIDYKITGIPEDTNAHIVYDFEIRRLRSTNPNNPLEKGVADFVGNIQGEFETNVEYQKSIKTKVKESNPKMYPELAKK